MDRELFSRCMAALRSGEYRQCRNWLHTSDGYCYQGVCMETAYPGLKWEPFILTTRIEDYPYQALGSASLMPLDLANRIGLLMNIKVSRIDCEGDLHVEDIPLFEYLSELNDGGFSLSFIAAVAESYFEVGNDDAA